MVLSPGLVGRNTIENNTVPRITKAAVDAGRPAPRVIVGLPVCVHDNRDQAIARSVQIFKGYGTLPNYRRQLDAEGHFRGWRDRGSRK